METCEPILKSWGNSAAVIIPKSVIEKEKLKIGQKVRILVASGGNAPAKTWGMFKGRGLSGQEAKDMCRKELWGIE